MSKLSKQKVESYYDSVADKWVAKTDRDPDKYYFSPYFNRLARLGLKGRRAADIGCGGGTFTFELCKYPFDELYALDLSENMLRIVAAEQKKRNFREILLIKGDVTKLPFEDNSINFIISIGVMECLPSQHAALSEIRRVLAKDGTAYIRWINRESIWGAMEYMLKLLKIPSSPFSYSDYFRLDQLQNQIRDAGLKTKHIEGAVVLPIFLFPRPLSTLLEHLLIRTKISYWLEGRANTRRLIMRRFYYAYCTEVCK